MLKRALSIGAYALCIRAYQLLRACRLCSYRALELLSCLAVVLLGESVSPFIDEEDGLTSQKRKERERVHVLPSIVAHAVGYSTPSPTLLFMICCI